MSRAMPLPHVERDVWDRHWRRLRSDAALFGRLTSLVRRWVLQRAVRHYAGRWLPASGVLVETGCGTGEASMEVPHAGRRLIGADLSLSVLLAGPATGPYDGRVVADVRHLPFAEGTVAGTWNLGVLEHFEPDDGLCVLRELGRVLSPGGVALLFWPPTFGSSRLVLAPIEALRSALSGRRFRFFPDEVNLLRSRRRGRAMLEAAGLEPLAVDFSLRDAFIHIVLVARKKA